MATLSDHAARLEYGNVFTTTRVLLVLCLAVVVGRATTGPPSAGEEMLVGDYQIVGYGVAGASLS